MPKNLAFAALTGLLTSGLFCVVFGANLGFVFMFLPTLPLFFLGLGRNSRVLYIALLTATALIALFTDVAWSISFIMFLGLPVWFFSRRALLHTIQKESGQVYWYPIGLIILHLSLYACVLVALMVGHYADLPGGLPHILSQNIHDAFMDLQEEYGDIIDRLGNQFVFLMFPATIWLWGILLYGHAWLVNRALTRQRQQVRPDVSVTLFSIPGWMLQLLAIAALATLIGGDSMSFLGKSTLLSLMLPYFFLGCAIMHGYFKTSGKSAASIRFILFFIYFLILTEMWPVLILAGIGLRHQIKSLRADTSWFKS